MKDIYKSYFFKRLVVLIVITLLFPIIPFLSHYGDLFELVGSILFGTLLALSVFFLVGGSLDELRNNTDRKGRKYSWKNSVFGILLFIISIPFVIWAALYFYGYL